MDVKCLAGSCVFVFAVHVAFLDEEGGVVELVGKMLGGGHLQTLRAFNAYLWYCMHGCDKSELREVLGYSIGKSSRYRCRSKECSQRTRHVEAEEQELHAQILYSPNR